MLARIKDQRQIKYDKIQDPGGDEGLGSGHTDAETKGHDFSFVLGREALQKLKLRRRV